MDNSRLIRAAQRSFEHTKSTVSDIDAIVNRAVKSGTIPVTSDGKLLAPLSRLSNNAFGSRSLQ